MDAMTRARRALFAPVDLASLAFFRVAFGGIMVWEVLRYFGYGWIHRYWVEPAFHFTYFGFGWVRPWPGDGMAIHFVALGALAVLIAAGLFYRVAAALFFLGFTYAFLLEQARYLNHFYLICLLSLLMVAVPAHRAFSLDALRRPALRSRTGPAWALWILRAQVGIAYFYAGLAKLNADWLRGEPMRMWLAGAGDVPVVGPLLVDPRAAPWLSWGGLAFDLAIVPLLLWRRTRAAAFALAVGFHVLNAEMFSIGIFPWLMIAATTLFFEPDWPRRLARRLRRAWPTRTAAGPTGATAGATAAAAGPARGPAGERLVLACLAAYVALQLLVPFRHYLYPGEVSWTEEGHRFAWHMKLRDKDAQAVFLIVDGATGRTGTVDPSRLLTSWQARKMAGRPDMILQFAHHLADRARETGIAEPRVRALVNASLNGRPAGLLVDPSVDLAAERRTLAPARWILPLPGTERARLVGAPPAGPGRPAAP